MTSKRDYPMLRNQLARMQKSITALLNQAEEKPPMNYDQFKHLADAALESVSDAINFLGDGMVEQAAICAIHSAEYLAWAGEATGLPLIKRSQRALLNSRKGNIEAHGTEEEREQRARELQIFIEDLKKKRPDIKSHTELCKEAARMKKNISYKTIWRKTQDPYK